MIWDSIINFIEQLGLKRIIIDLSFILGGVIIGWVVEKFVLKKLHKAALKTKWEGDEVIIQSLKGLVIFLFIELGLYLSLIDISHIVAIPSLVYKIFIVGIVFVVTLFFARLSDKFIKLWTKGAEDSIHSISILPTLAKLIIYIVAALVIMQTFGISITPILTALGVGGLAVALALRDTLANLFAGIHIIASKQVKPKDYIKLSSGEEGYVEDISWRNTTIKALGNNLIIIPNEKLASSIITNYFKPTKVLSVVVDVGVSYDSDLEKVEKITVDVARKVLKDVPGGISDIEPFIRYKEFGDFSINFSVIMKAREFVDQYRLKHEFIKALHKTYKKKGIEIPYPVTTVHLKDDKKSGRKK